MKPNRSLWNSLRKAVTILVLAALLAGVGPVQAQTENPPEALEAAQDNKACLPDIYEPNNTITQAFLLDPNDSIQAQLCPSNEDDYYAVDLTAGQELVVTLAYYNYYSDELPKFEIMDEYGNSVDELWVWKYGVYTYNQNGNEHSSYSFIPQQSGRYYIRVNPG